jgi:hypothetical protein
MELQEEGEEEEGGLGGGGGETDLLGGIVQGAAEWMENAYCK